MARKVLVRLVDDLDGLPSDDVATVTFSLDRVSYQIDLNESNASKLREGLAEFVAAARRTGGRIRRGSAGARAAGSANDGPAIREWAREQGHQLAERGRIPSHIVDAFHAATGKGGRAKVVEVTAKPARAAKSAATAAPKAAPKAARSTAKTAAASRSAAGATATASTRRTRAAKPAGTQAAAKGAATTAKSAKSTAAKSTAAKTADKGTATTSRTAAKAAKTPRTTASTAAAKGTRARRSPAAKSR